MPDENAWREETACISFLLATSDTAPACLTREDVEKLVRRVEIEFDESFGTKYTKFYYTPFLLLGLLRFRLVDPKALIVGSDLLAENLKALVERAVIELKQLRRTSSRSSHRYDRYIGFLYTIETALWTTYQRHQPQVKKFT